MGDKHTELEYKFAADHLVDKIDKFRRELMEANPTSFEHVKHDDAFWKRGANVVRHRMKGPGAGELTVKQRRSQDSLVDRLEVNLKFSPGLTIPDVQAFLMATGYEPLFTLRKSFVDVFEFKRSLFSMEVALYDVARVDEHGLSGKRTFLELEIKPEEGMDDFVAKENLSAWARWAQNAFQLGEPLNLSLFEYYSDLRSPSVNPDQGTNYRI